MQLLLLLLLCELGVGEDWVGGHGKRDIRMHRRLMVQRRLRQSRHVADGDVREIVNGEICVQVGLVPNVLRQVAQAECLALASDFHNDELEHVKLGVVLPVALLVVVMMMVVLLVGHVGSVGRELVLVENVCRILFGPGDYCRFEQKRVKLEHFGSVELRLELRRQVVQLHHVVVTVVGRAFEELVDFDDEDAPRLTHHRLLNDLLADLLDNPIFLTHKTFFVPQEVTVFALEAFQLLLEVAKVNRQ